MMYGWLWRRLPGGTGAKTVTAALIALGALALLWLWIFPWAAAALPLRVVAVPRR